MRKIFFLSIFVCVSLSLKAISTNNHCDDCDLTFEIEAQKILLNVPEKVFTKFRNSFILEDGKFRGAFVGEIREYISLSEIIVLINYQGYAALGPKIIDRHKPRRPVGCRLNDKWICQFNDDHI